MSAPVTTVPVLVTGATGFIASRLVEQLLARGYRVRGTVRSLRKPGDIDRLRQLPGAAERLDLVEADLTKTGSFDTAVDGCHVVMHTASPYAITVKDPQRDLVDPAVNGTRDVLAACHRAGTVRRVILTSSFAAITDEPDAAHVLTEKDWNEKSSLSRNPYYFSKVLAEKAAWAFVHEQRPAFDLVAINPFMVIGPSLVASLNESNKMLRDFLAGSFPVILALTLGYVDVRDVADAHIRAMETPSAHGRYLCAGDVLSMREIVALLKTHGYASYKLPRLGMDSSVGTAVMRAVAWTQPSGVASFLRTNLGHVPRYDTTRIRSELGMTFRPATQSILETIPDLVKWGHLK